MTGTPDRRLKAVTEALGSLPLERRVPGYGHGLSAWDKEQVLDILEADEPWCNETLASDDGILTCQIAGPHRGNRHEAQSGDAIYAWDTGSSEYTVGKIAWTCTCDCDCLAPGQPDDDGTPGWCDSCRMNIHQEAGQ